MNKRLQIKIAAIGILVSLYSCTKKTTSLDINLGREYYPIATGKSITYKVDSTIYDDFTGNTYLTHCYIKDVIDTSFQDLLGQTAYYVKRFYKSDTATDYSFQNLYTVTAVSNRVEVMYDNLRYIKLVFPVTYLGSWGGNGYINTNSSKEPYAWIGDKPYTYKDLGKQFKNDSLTFPNTLTVFHMNELLPSSDTTAAITGFAEYTYSSEKYAKDIGLVNKEMMLIKKDLAIGGGKRRGFALKMNCIAYE